MERTSVSMEMLKNTPAGYKKEYPWLKEVDSLALANVQLNLEGAFRKFFREPGMGFPHYKSKKHSRKSYTTNMVNGNICLQDRFLKLKLLSTEDLPDQQKGYKKYEGKKL